MHGRDVGRVRVLGLCSDRPKTRQGLSSLASPNRHLGPVAPVQLLDLGLLSHCNQVDDTGRRAKGGTGTGHEARVPRQRPRGLQAWARADRLEDLPYLGSGS